MWISGKKYERLKTDAENSVRMEKELEKEVQRLAGLITEKTED